MYKKEYSYFFSYNLKNDRKNSDTYIFLNTKNLFKYFLSIIYWFHNNNTIFNSFIWNIF